MMQEVEFVQIHVRYAWLEWRVR